MGPIGQNRPEYPFVMIPGLDDSITMLGVQHSRLVEESSSDVDIVEDDNHVPGD